MPPDKPGWACKCVEFESQALAPAGRKFLDGLSFTCLKTCPICGGCGQPHVVPAKPNDATLPTYYNSGARDLITLAFELGMGEDACAFNIAKYCLRYQKKNGLQYLKKAKVYLDRLIAHEESKASGSQ